MVDLNVSNSQRLENLALKPDIKLFRDGNHSVLQIGDLQLPMHNNIAVVLSLFNGERSLDLVIEMVKIIFKMEHKKAIVYTESIVHRFNPFFVNEMNPKDNPNCYLDSRDFSGGNYDYKLPTKYPVPVVMSINTTFHCDRKCIYCYLNAKHDSVIEEECISNERLRGIINEAADIGVCKIVFIGGEPFLRKDTIEMLKLCSERRIHSQVTTKAYLSDHQLDELAKIDFFEMILSYDINDEKICNEMSGDPHMYQEIDSTLKRAMEKNIKVCIAPVLCTLNADSFLDFITYLTKLNVHKISVTRYFKSIGRHDDHLQLDQKKWNQLKEDSRKINQDIRFSDENINLVRDTWSIIEEEFYVHNPTTCSQGRTNMTVLPDGKVSYCGFLVRMNEYLTYGDLKEQSILEAWHSDRLMRVINPQREMYKNSPCFDCSSFDDCPFRMKCINQSYIESKTFFAPSQQGRFHCSKYKQLTSVMGAII